MPEMKVIEGLGIKDPLEVFEEGEMVRNRFGFGEIFLQPEEVAVYDLCMGSEMIGDYKTVRKCIDWFIKNNSEAYMTLLD